MPTACAAEETRRRLREAFAWSDGRWADLSGWWSDAGLLPLIGPALAALYAGESPTLVLSPEATGFTVGALTAVAAGTGFAEMRRNWSEANTGSARVLRRDTPPDYLGRVQTWGVERQRLRSGQRVLFVDDWADTGATVSTARRLVEGAGAVWVGAAVLVDGLSPAARRDLAVRAVLRERELR